LRAQGLDAPMTGSGEQKTSGVWKSSGSSVILVLVAAVLLTLTTAVYRI
jgi:hypothetical protein